MKVIAEHQQLLAILGTPTSTGEAKKLIRKFLFGLSEEEYVKTVDELCYNDNQFIATEAKLMRARSDNRLTKEQVEKEIKRLKTHISDCKRVIHDLKKYITSSKTTADVVQQFSDSVIQTSERIEELQKKIAI